MHIDHSYTCFIANITAVNQLQYLLLVEPEACAIADWLQ